MIQLPEFGQILRRDRTVLNDQRILVIALAGVAAEVIRAGDDDLFIDYDHLVMHVVLITVKRDRDFLNEHFEIVGVVGMGDVILEK